MNTSPLLKTYTLEEFWELPDPPDHSKIELIAGVVYMTPPPGQVHDTVVSRLIRAITRHLLETDDKGSLLAPRAAIWTSANTYLEPDLFYVSADLAGKLDPERRTSADLVIEVVSPGSAIYDRNTKAETYWALGVRELWLVDEQNRSIEVRAMAREGFDVAGIFKAADTVSSTVLPGLGLRVSEIF